MRKNAYLLVLTLLWICLVLSACAPSSSQTQNSESAEEAQGQPTVVVMRTLDLAALPPTPTFPPPPSPTPQLTPTQEILPTSTIDTIADVVPTLTSTPTCTNQAEFIQHISIPPKTSIKDGSLFSKIWRVKNIGTCTWTTGYSLVFVSGDSQILYSPASMPLPNEVKPGETADLSVFLVAPSELKEFGGNWMLKDEAGNVFGVGAAGNDPLIASIVVDKWKEYIPSGG